MPKARETRSLGRPNRYDKSQPANQGSDAVDKYKMVKFFERKKIERKITQLEKKKKDAESVDQELEKELEAWIDKRNYVKFYPKSQKYVSILKGTLTKVQEEKVKHTMTRCKKFAKFLENKTQREQARKNLTNITLEKEQKEEPDFFL